MSADAFDPSSLPVKRVASGALIRDASGAATTGPDVPSIPDLRALLSLIVVL